jgi:hypothetical protein
MKEQEILLALEELTADLGVTLRYEKGDFEGGFCRVDDDKVIIINAGTSRKAKIGILARELGRFSLDEVFIVPAVRKIIEKNQERNDQGAHEIEEESHDAV